MILGLGVSAVGARKIDGDLRKRIVQSEKAGNNLQHRRLRLDDDVRGSNRTILPPVRKGARPRMSQTTQRRERFQQKVSPNRDPPHDRAKLQLPPQSRPAKELQARHKEILFQPHHRHQARQRHERARHKVSKNRLQERPADRELREGNGGDPARAGPRHQSEPAAARRLQGRAGDDLQAGRGGGRRGRGGMSEDRAVGQEDSHAGLPERGRRHDPGVAGRHPGGSSAAEGLRTRSAQFLQRCAAGQRQA